MYACKKLDKSGAGEKPVAFLESLVLGEVEHKQHESLGVWFVDLCGLSEANHYNITSSCFSGRIGSKEDSFATMSLPARPK